MRFAAGLIAALLLVAACGSTPTTTPATVTPIGTTGVALSPSPGGSTAPPPSVSPVASASASGVSNVPASCQVLLTVLAPYTGNISGTQSLGKPGHLSCEYQYNGGTSVIIVTIGSGGTQASYDALKAGTATGGRTVKDVTNLGVAAFSVSKGGKPGGVTSLAASGNLYVVESTLLFTQDIALIRDLMQLP